MPDSWPAHRPTKIHNEQRYYRAAVVTEPRGADEFPAGLHIVAMAVAAVFALGFLAGALTAYWGMAG